MLTAHDVPSILVETAFISTPTKSRRLNDDAYQDKLARAILDGIREYVGKHPPRPAGPVTACATPLLERSQAKKPGDTEIATISRITTVRLFLTIGWLPNQ